jgi:hypothetical protein
VLEDACEACWVPRSCPDKDLCRSERQCVSHLGCCLSAALLLLCCCSSSVVQVRLFLPPLKFVVSFENRNPPAFFCWWRSSTKLFRNVSHALTHNEDVNYILKQFTEPRLTLPCCGRL